MEIFVMSFQDEMPIFNIYIYMYQSYHLMTLPLYLVLFYVDLSTLNVLSLNTNITLSLSNDVKLIYR